MNFKAEKFKVIALLENGDKYIIPTVNATAIITSIHLNELTEKLEKHYNEYNNLSSQIKDSIKRVELLYSSHKENNSQETEIKLREEIDKSKALTRKADLLIREITKTTLEIIKSTVRDFETHKQFIYSIPDEKQNEFIVFLRIASLGGESDVSLDEKKIENIFLNTINIS